MYKLSIYLQIQGNQRNIFPLIKWILVLIGDTLCITYFNTKLYLNYGFYQFYTYDTL